MECQLALRDDDDDEDDDASYELSDSDDDEDLALAPGALVALRQDLAKGPSDCQRFFRLEKLQGQGDSASAVVRLLDGKRGTESTYKGKDLVPVSQKDIGL